MDFTKKQAKVDNNKDLHKYSNDAFKVSIRQTFLPIFV